MPERESHDGGVEALCQEAYGDAADKADVDQDHEHFFQQLYGLFVEPFFKNAVQHLVVSVLMQQNAEILSGIFFEKAVLQIAVDDSLKDVGGEVVHAANCIGKGIQRGRIISDKVFRQFIEDCLLVSIMKIKRAFFDADQLADIADGGIGISLLRKQQQRSRQA